MKDNGVISVRIPVTQLRIIRVGSRWMVEYRRTPKWIFGLDRWWWFDDGVYTEYNDALKRVNTLKTLKYVTKTKFIKYQKFEVEDDNA